MTWKRLATFGAAAVMGVVGAVVPAAAPVLIPLATGLTGLALRWPEDQPPETKKREPQG